VRRKRFSRRTLPQRPSCGGRSVLAHFNFSRIHEAHRVTPAMAQRITDHVWTIGELLTACLENAPAKPRKVHRRFTVIQGGKQ
jgi:hypothetical protein